MNRLEQIKKFNGILLSEMPMYRASAEQFHDDIQEQRRLLRSLMNVRPPMRSTAEFIALQDDLPSRYVIHTVGPIIDHKLTDSDCELLKSCYRSCLELAVQNHCKPNDFCCISTGEFRFPNEKAAEIAVRTVSKFLKYNETEVIFNVFKEQDENIYRRLLS